MIGIAILQIYPKIVQQYSFYTQANQLKAEKEQLIQANEKLKQEKQDSHSKNTELSNQLSNTRQEKEQLETDVDRLNRENQKLFNQIENIKKENEKLSSQIYVLEREYASLEKSKSKEVSILKNKDRESQQNINALVDLAKLDDSIISKYRTALLGIQVALSANNFDQALIAAAIADRLKSDAENLEIKRNRILGR